MRSQKIKLQTMEWERGVSLGHGSFGSVSLAKPRANGLEDLPFMAVKSSSVVSSASLKNEKDVLEKLSSCPNVIRCLGDCYSYEKGNELYNVFLEFAANGSLCDRIKNCGNRIPESDVKDYTREILKGLKFVHENGFVHCDIKCQNILFCLENGREVVKIADFGLAKKAQSGKERGIRGTPLYMSPESVTGGEFESPADIWALGCLVVEMVTGKPAWGGAYDISSLLFKIGAGDELPEIPAELSAEGKDLLGKCFVKDATKRWTAEMLLDHPFVQTTCNDDEFDRSTTVPFKVEDEASISPRCPFDFPEWISPISISHPKDFDSVCSNCDSSSSTDTIRQLITNDLVPDWVVSDSWITVRCH